MHPSRSRMHPYAPVCTRMPAYASSVPPNKNIQQMFSPKSQEVNKHITSQKKNVLPSGWQSGSKANPNHICSSNHATTENHFDVKSRLISDLLYFWPTVKLLFLAWRQDAESLVERSDLFVPLRSALLQ